MTRLWMGLFVATVVGCGSSTSSTSSEAAGAGGGGSTATTGGTAPTGGMAPVGAGGAGGQGAGTSAAGAGGGSSVSGIANPMPPPGATECSAGTFTAADAVAACQMPPTIGELHPSYPAQCGLASTAGGAFSLWCDASGPVYLWVRYDQVAFDSGCTFLPALEFGHLELQSGPSGLSTTPYEAMPSASASLDWMPRDVGWHFEIFSFSGASGTGHLWLSGTAYCGGNDVWATVVGLAFAWSI